MSAAVDPHIVAAVRLLISDVQRSVAPAVAEARFYQRLDAIKAENSETFSERCKRENEEGLRYMAALGNGRGVARKAARRMAPNNPIEQYNLAQRFSGLLRKQK